MNEYLNKYLRDREHTVAYDIERLEQAIQKQERVIEQSRKTIDSLNEAASLEIGNPVIAEDFKEQINFKLNAEEIELNGIIRQLERNKERLLALKAEQIDIADERSKHENTD